MTLEEAKERTILTGQWNFNTNEIIPGQFVHLGYIEDSNSLSSHTFKYGSKTQKYVNKDNDEKLGTYANGQTKFGQALGKVRDSEKYQQALAGSRATTPFDIGDGHIVKIGSYKINWRDDKSLAKDFENATNQELDIRRRHGFGKDASEYKDDDWRHNYGGTGERRVTDPRYANNGSKYQNYLGGGFYANIDDANKIAARQNLASDSKNLQSSQWYFADENGELEKLDKEMMKFLIGSFGKPAVDKAVAEVSEEEASFKAEMSDLNSYRNLVNKQFLMSNILYIVATVRHPDGSVEPVTWINTEIVKEFPYIQWGELSHVIQNAAKAIVLEPVAEQKTYYLSQKEINEIVNKVAHARVEKMQK